jgi:hypothetical protein
MIRMVKLQSIHGRRLHKCLYKYKGETRLRATDVACNLETVALEAVVPRDFKRQVGNLHIARRGCLTGLRPLRWAST